MKKKYVNLLLAFFIPFIILVLFYFSRKIGSTYSLLISDFQSQYLSLFTYLRNLSFGDIFYSFSKGLGGGMFGTFSYYLSSPLNALIYLFPKDNMVLATIVIITLKISLSGLCMYLYLKHKFKTEKYSMLMFSTCYALMSYVVNYYFHIMWLDGVMILPIVMLGIENIIRKKSSLLYILSLTYAIFSNYYIGYMICIGSVIYFLFELIAQYRIKEQKKEVMNIIIRFAISSFLSGFMCMILIIPTLIELKMGYKANASVMLGLGVDFNFFDLWSRSYIGSHNYDTILANNEISIYAGLIILPLLYFFFVNKSIEIRKKIVYGCLIVLLFSGFFVEIVNTVWHAFNTANCFNYRYSFIICFMLIMISYHSFMKIEQISIKHYFAFFIFYLILTVIMFFRKYDYLNYVSLCVSVGCIGIYLFLLYQYHRYNKNNDIKFLLFGIVCAEILFNLFISLRTYDFFAIDEYAFYENKINPSIQEVNEFDYRVEKNFSFTYNDGLLLGYKGITNFLSTMDLRQIFFAKNVGFYSSGMADTDNGNNTYIVDALLGIKYRLDDFDWHLYEKIGVTDIPMFSGLLFHPTLTKNVNIYKNPYALSIGYMIKEQQVKEIIFENPFEYQNYILNSMVGTDNEYFKPYSKEKVADAHYKFFIDNEELIYVYYPFVCASKISCNVLIDNKKVSTLSEIFPYESNIKNSTLDVILDGTVSSYGEPYLYYFDEDLFINDIKLLQQNNININKMYDGYIMGSVNVNSEMPTLFLSIPYEDGWKLYVDGKETEIEVMFDTFMGVNLSEGKHTIELKYSVPGLKLGGVISGLSLVCTFVYLYFERKTRKEKEIKLEKTLE